MTLNPLVLLLRPGFAGQFETEGGEVVFRRNGRGIGYRTSETERDAAVEWYARRIGKLFWFGVAGLAAIIALGAVEFFREEAAPYLAMVAALLGLALWLYLIESARRVPERVLMHREVVGLKRAPEIQLPWIERTSWTFIWIMAAIAAAPLVGSYLTDGDAELPIKLTSGAALLFIGYQAIRKAKLADAARAEMEP